MITDHPRDGGIRDRCGDGRVASEDDRDHREYMNHVGGVVLTLLSARVALLLASRNGW